MQSNMVNRNLSTTASTQCFCPSTQKSFNNNIPILNRSWHTYGLNFILSKVREREMVRTVGIWTRHFSISTVQLQSCLQITSLAWGGSLHTNVGAGNVTK